jgi:hypothetical protein
MSVLETFTGDEILKILSEIEVDTEYESASDNEANIATVTCEIGDVSFYMFLIHNEPFFEGFRLFSFRYTDDQPFQYASAFNETRRIGRVMVDIDDDGLIAIDEDGDATLKLIADISFAGGVTKDHVRFMLQMWIEDLIDFNEEFFDNEDEEEIIDVPELQNLPAVTLQVQITACLSGGRSMTAREMSRVLEVDRHDINSILYKERNRFEHDGEQPPRWSLKKA